MKWRSIFHGGLLLRTIARELAGIRVALQQQNLYLARVADQIAPALPAADAPSLADTGYSAFDQLEGGLVLDYIAKTERDTGRAPTEDEVLTYLADEKTQDLHLRLKAREQELAGRSSQ